MNDNDNDIERQNLGRNREIVQMERALEMGELERLKLDEELRKSRRKCEVLEETVARLLQENRISNDREKKAEDRCKKISAENTRISDEYQALVHTLNEKVGELQRSKSEHEEEFKCFDAMVSKFDGVIRRLEREKSAAARAVEELKLENIQLRREKLETPQPYKSSLDKLSSRMSRIEKDLAGVLSVNVGDLATVANQVRELATTEGEDDDSPRDDGDSSYYAEGSADSKGEDDGDSSGNAQNGYASSPEVGSPLSAGISDDDRDMVHPCERREDADAHTFEDSPEGESSECEKPLESGAHLDRPSTKSAAAITTVIDIIDSDDETTNPNGVALLVPTPQKSKRNRTNSDEGLLIGKRKRDTCTEDMANAVPTHEKENQIHEPTSIGKDSSVQKLSAASDEDSEDECLSDSKMNEMVKNLGYESMLQTIKADDEFCMSAVCALYRQHLSASKSKGHLDPSTDAGFFHSARGCGIAKYLIGGDGELRLRKLVSEVKKEIPSVIDDCRNLATAYAKKLFDLHWSGVDPFFRQS